LDSAESFQTEKSSPRLELLSDKQFSQRTETGCVMLTGSHAASDRREATNNVLIELLFAIWRCFRMLCPRGCFLQNKIPQYVTQKVSGSKNNSSEFSPKLVKRFISGEFMEFPNYCQRTQIR